MRSCSFFFFFHRMVFKATQVALLFSDFLVVSEIDSSFLLNKHGDPPPPQFFFRYLLRTV